TRRLDGFYGGGRHQGVVARVEVKRVSDTLDDLLEGIEKPLLLVLDGVTDPHNLGACLRVANAAGAHAVIAPKDRAAGITPPVSCSDWRSPSSWTLPCISCGSWPYCSCPIPARCPRRTRPHRASRCFCSSQRFSYGSWSTGCRFSKAATSAFRSRLPP